MKQNIVDIELFISKWENLIKNKEIDKTEILINEIELLIHDLVSNLECSVRINKTQISFWYCEHNMKLSALMYENSNI